MEKVVQKSADVVAVSGEDVFLARELYELELQVVAEMRLKEAADGNHYNHIHLLWKT